MSNFAGVYFDNLQRLAVEDKWSDFLRPILTADAAEELRALEESDDIVWQKLGRVMRSLVKRMQSCRKEKPCKTMGCPRCGRMCNLQVGCKDAQLISRHTIMRRGRALAFTCGRFSWIGPAAMVIQNMREDIPKLQQRLDKNPLIKGYVLYLDACIDSVGRLTDTETMSLRELESLDFNFHLHGVILTGPVGYKSLVDKIWDDVEFNGIPSFDITDIKPLKSTFRDGKGTKRNDICSFKDVAPWTCYASKLQARGKGNTERTRRVLQRGLYGVQTCWRGGCLAKCDWSQNSRSAIDHRIEKVREWQIETSQLVEGLAANSIAPETFITLTNLLSQLGEIERTLRQNSERLRKRASRKRKRVQQLRSRFHGDRLAAEIEKYELRAEIAREDRLEELQAIWWRTRDQWAEAERHIVESILEVGHVLSQTPNLLSGCLELWYGPRTSNPLLNLATFVAAVIRYAELLAVKRSKLRATHEKRSSGISYCGATTEQDVLANQVKAAAQLFIDWDEQVLEGFRAGNLVSSDSDVQKERLLEASRLWVSRALLSEIDD